MPFRPSPAGARRVAAVALAAASLVAAAAVGSVFLSTARDSSAAIASAGPASPADGILLVVTVAGAVLSLWLGLGLTLSALSALPGALGQASSQLAARIAPATVRNVVAFVLGTALTASFVPGSTGARSDQHVLRPATVASAQHVANASGASGVVDVFPANARGAVGGVGAVGAIDAVGAVGGLTPVGALADAAPDASFRSLRHAITDVGALDGAPGPSWSPARRAVSFGGDPDDVVEVVVHRGDTLWSIAARHLGPRASEAEIDAGWHRWFAANRAVIGRDPNVIAPGQRLSPPGQRLSPQSHLMSPPGQQPSAPASPGLSVRGSS